MTEEFQPLRECRRCKELRPQIPGQQWLYNICPQCQAELPAAPALRKCSRCGFHRPDWQTKASYCPECWRDYQRERRAARKAEGRREWSVKECSQCGVTEEMPPDNAWCRECRNAYQRAWKREHPDAYELPPQPPQPVTGREPLRTCARCKRSRPYNRKEFKRGSVCRKCYQGYRKTAEQNEREKFRLWRETGAMAECRKCHQVKPYGKGWDGRLCPQCQAERAAKQYEEVKASPERLKARKEKQDAARRRRQDKAVQKDENQAESRSSVEQPQRRRRRKTRPRAEQGRL